MNISRTKKITLAFIRKYSLEHGYPPTIQEMADDRGIANNAIQEHVISLQNTGFITKKTFTARSIIITEQGMEELETV